MNEFSLIKQLESGEEPKKPVSTIKYQQYELVVEGKEMIVNIPKREAEAFEIAVGELNTQINRPMMQNMLRTFRGTRS